VQDFRKSFVREQDGAWLCKQPVELPLPTGRIQVAAGTRFTRGTRFMGVDVAKLLDEEPPTS
jgi:hypothetical protein